MSIDVTQAWAVIRARAEEQITGLTLLWQAEDNRVPDLPEAFVYFEVDMARSAVIEVGGGRGANRHRHRGALHGFVFAPMGEGLARVLALAEPVAVAFRSYSSGDVRFDTASVHPLGEGADLVPPGIRSAAGNYAAALVAAPFYFDQTA